MNLKIKEAGIIIFLGLAFCLTAPTFAQQQKTEPKKGWGEQNKLEDAEIVVEKNRVNELPEANRNYEKFKIDPPEVKPQKVTYRFTDYKMADLNLNLTMRVLTIKQEDLTKLYGNYVKLGFGNYGTPYLKGYFHNKRDNQAAYGAEISHVSSSKGPVDNSGVSNSAIGLSGETYNGDLTAGGKLSYGLDKYHFYGYDKLKDINVPVNAEDIAQKFNRIGASVFINNKLGKGPATYEAGLGVDYFNNAFGAKESNIKADLGVGYALDKIAKINVDADLSFISYKDETGGSLTPANAIDQNRTYFRLQPTYVRQTEKLGLTIGATIGYTNDTINDARQFNIYPALSLSYEVVDDKVQVFGGIGGDLERITLNRLTLENPFLNTNVNVADANKTLDIYGGITGNLTKDLKFTGKVAYQNFRNLYFFNNSRRDTSRFDVIYDTVSTKVINVFGELSYNQSERLRIGVKADYNAYTTDKLAQPFHRPAMQATVFGSYNLYDKIFFHSELYYISSTFGQITRPTGDQIIKETDTIIDLNLKVDYRFSNKFSTFVMANNILGNKYQRFIHYPNKGIQVIAGISYIF